ncbi:MAG: hypothetical protein NC548_49530 [Lachnospiraceae bacterium]|nr:hypothetical protein [Lachnospiraceae bacterium]
MAKGIEAFSDPRFDYYELQEDLANIVPKGAIFVHDTEDQENGSIAEGCLKLCWTPDGNCYSSERLGSVGLCGGTVIFHASFKDSTMFKRVRFGKGKALDEILKEVAWIERGLKKVKKLIEEQEELN